MQPEYRTPEEVRQQNEHEQYVRRVLDQAVHNGASLFTAMRLDEDPAVVEQWIDRLWNNLRAGLVDERPRPQADGYRREDRLTAIVMLLTDRMNAESDQMLRIGQVPE